MNGETRFAIGEVAAGDSWGEMLKSILAQPLRLCFGNTSVGRFLRGGRPEWNA